MRYPNFLSDNSSIGIVASSFGCKEAYYKVRLKEALKYLEESGYKLNKATNIYKQSNLASSSSSDRYNNLTKIFNKSDIVWSVSGGEVMMEILNHLNFDDFKNAPWYIGYSDDTNMTFLLTTHLDLATIYGYHVPLFGVEQFSSSHNDLLELLKGNKLKFKNYSKYQKFDFERTKKNYLKGLNLTHKVKYNSLYSKNVYMEGRLIGGCLDIIQVLCGTKFDKVSDFLEKYKENGFIWYFDSCDYNPIQFYRSLMQLELSGYFKYLKGVILGRVFQNETYMEFDFTKALRNIFDKYHIEVIRDCDFGHVLPQFPIINGSYCVINYKNDEFEIEYKLI